MNSYAVEFWTSSAMRSFAIAVSVVVKNHRTVGDDKEPADGLYVETGNMITGDGRNGRQALRATKQLNLPPGWFRRRRPDPAALVRSSQAHSNTRRIPVSHRSTVCQSAPKSANRLARRVFHKSADIPKNG